MTCRFFLECSSAKLRNIEDWFYTENDQIIGYIPEFYFLEDKTNLRMLYLPDYLPEATTDLLSTGIENTTNRTFYQDKRAGSPEDDGYYEIELENVYKAIVHVEPFIKTDVENK